MPDWGTVGIEAFTPTNHDKPYPAIDPNRVRLPSSSIVCVLGASRGIGAGVAYSYARAGAGALILSSRSSSSLHDVATQCRELSPLGKAVRVDVVECDISSTASVRQLADTIKARFGGLDVVVVNAGWSGVVTLDVTLGDPDEFRQVTDVNYVGTYLAAHFLLPLLLPSPTPPPPPPPPPPPSSSSDSCENGMQKAFLAVGSLASFLIRGPIANTQYCVSKLAQLKLIEHVHEQYAAQGILAAAIHPGAVLSQMAIDTAPEDFKQYLTDDPELCGAFCVWLTKTREGGEGVEWLGGRQLVAKWDVDELLGRKEEIVSKDLLKTKLAL
ncbi:hypothetical protein MBLNU459_g4736t1 [Dothideomycetes sp. NU459]